VLRAPDHRVAEVLNRDLYSSPRHAGPHAEAASDLGAKLPMPRRSSMRPVGGT
jgi:hypothetical protein